MKKIQVLPELINFIKLNKFNILALTTEKQFCEEALDIMPTQLSGRSN